MSHLSVEIFGLEIGHLLTCAESAAGKTAISKNIHFKPFSVINDLGEVVDASYSSVIACSSSLQSNSTSALEAAHRPLLALLEEGASDLNSLRPPKICQQIYFYDIPRNETFEWYEANGIRIKR